VSNEKKCREYELPAYADTWATPEEMAAASAKYAPMYDMPVCSADEIRAKEPRMIEAGVLEILPDGGRRLRLDKIEAMGEYDGEETTEEWLARFAKLDDPQQGERS
jgi:hypothetical protein